MTTYSLRLLVLIWAFPDLVSGFQNKRFLTPSLTRTTSKAASTVGRAEWTDDESLASSRDAAPRRRFNATFIDNLVSDDIFTPTYPLLMRYTCAADLIIFVVYQYCIALLVRS